MQRRFYIIGTVLIVILSFLLFNIYFKEPSTGTGAQKHHQLSSPDSSWLKASIDLNKIRKDIAWNTLLSGDFYKLFQTDTNNNTLIKLFKSPATFGISEEESIRYFSKWENKHMYQGLIFKLEDPSKLQSSIANNILSEKNNAPYTVRSKEGIWIFDSYNLLFLFTEDKDSITALRYFNHYSSSLKDIIVYADSGLVSCMIQTDYLPSEKKYALTDSTILRFYITNHENQLNIQWNYTGPLGHYLKNAVLPESPANTGLYYAAGFSDDSQDSTLTSLPFYLKYKELCKPFLKIIQNNTLYGSFNGWKKIKNSYYVSQMNEEFQVELKKKDTSFNEPVFTIHIENPDTESQHPFLSTLVKNRLITYQKNSTYKIIPGNFDSKLIQLKGKGILIQNKHHNTTLRSLIDTVNAAFICNLRPDYIKELNESGIMSRQTLESLYTIEQIKIIGRKDSINLSGHISFSFKDSEHPFIQMMRIASSLKK